MSETLSVNSNVSHYRILQKIGAGGMGEVYLAEDLKLGRKVALKILPETIAADKDRLRRFEQEARAASALNHPNILTVYEIGETPSEGFYIATEFVEGETLRERMHGEKLAIEEVLDIAVQTAAALCAAHEAGIVHRDIKPENIMIRRDRLVKVLDFGLAKLAGNGKTSVDNEAETRAQVKTEPGVVLGTVAYMSPEQARGKDTDFRSDVWSLGCVIYEMIAGQAPFAGETTADRIAAVIHKEPVPLSRFTETVPARLEEIVSKCLEKDRDERYQVVKDLLIDLRRLKRKLDFESEMERSHTPEVTEKTNGQTQTFQTQTISKSPTDAAQTQPTTSSAEYVVTEIKRHKKGFALTFIALGLAGALGAFLWYKFAGQNKTTSPNGNMRMTRLITGLSGRPGNVSISPDGKYVAYALWEAGKASLWVKQVSQDTSLQILPPVENARFEGTAFSHDGEIVYFVGGNRETNPLGSLYQVPVLGGKEPKKILDHVSFGISLSPDGKQFAFIRQFLETAEYHVMIANIDGSGEPKRIATRKGDSWFSDLSWSPSGKTIACGVSTVTGGLSSTIVEIPVEGGEEKPLTDYKWGNSVARLRWIRDGSGLVLNAAEKPASSRQLWHLSYPDGKVTRITSDLNDYGGAGITSDASTIVASLGEWTNRIWVAAPNEDEAKAKRISNGKDDGRMGLALLPDERIIYVSRVDVNQNLWIMNADGTENKVFRSDDTFPQSAPDVSPDGRYIVFVSWRPDNIPHIWRIDADGSNPKQLTDKEDYGPRFTPDGRWVVFGSFRSGKETLWKVPVDGGEAVQISDKVAGSPIVSPDGKLISCMYYDESAKPPRNRPALISFENGQLVRVLDFPSTAGRPGWSPDGREFIYVDTRNDVGNIWSQPVAGGAPKQLTRFTSDFIDAFRVSRDGKRFFISRASGNNDVVLIKDFK